MISLTWNSKTCSFYSNRKQINGYLGLGKLASKKHERSFWDNENAL